MSNKGKTSVGIRIKKMRNPLLQYPREGSTNYMNYFFAGAFLSSLAAVSAATARVD